MNEFEVYVLQFTLQKDISFQHLMTNFICIEEITDIYYYIT